MSRHSENSDEIVLRQPTAEDGFPLNQLIEACAPLDPNSVYCNLLQASHFAETSVAAELNGELVGFISGYVPPQQPDTLFIWQVAVHSAGRGRGLAKRMLKEILKRPACENVRYLDTTITEDNEASWNLFLSLARDLEAENQRSLKFEKERHFGGHHDSEYLLRIGPFDRSVLL